MRNRPGGLSHGRRLALGRVSRSGRVAFAFNVFSIGTESIRRVRAAQRTAPARDNTTVHTTALSLRSALRSAMHVLFFLHVVVVVVD